MRILNGKELHPRSDGRFHILYPYRNKIMQRLVRVVPCAGCGAERLSYESNFRRAGEKAYCRRCQSDRVSGLQRKGLKYKHGKSGYLLIYCPNHPAAKHGYIPLHRKIVEDSIGRNLTDAERVHHIDCDKENNAIENLVVVDVIEHNKAHGSLNSCAKRLIEIGALQFNRSTLRYEVCS